MHYRVTFEHSASGQHVFYDITALDVFNAVMKATIKVTKENPTATFTVFSVSDRG